MVWLLSVFAFTILMGIPVIFVLGISAPASTKSGIASKMNWSTPANMRCGMTRRYCVCPVRTK